MEEEEKVRMLALLHAFSDSLSEAEMKLIEAGEFAQQLSNEYFGVRGNEDIQRGKSNIWEMTLVKIVDCSEYFANLACAFVGSGMKLTIHGLQLQNKIETYDEKKNVCKYYNSIFRYFNIAIAHPADEEACNLFAVASRDGLGRYTLENRQTKKRSGFYKTLSEITPLNLTPDLSRFASKKPN